MKATNPILLVLLFREAKASREFGPTLWAALQEVESFYMLGWPSSSFRRVYLWDEVSSSVEGNAPLNPEAVQAVFSDRKFWSLVKGRYTRTCDQNRLVDLTRVNLKLLASQHPESSAFAEWLRTGRVDSDPETVSQRPRPGAGKRSLRKRHKDSRNAKDDWGVEQISKLTLIIVTDQEITPREDWVYIVSDDIVADDGSLASVISVATTDPLYWREDNENRLATIKQRVRSLCLQAVGQYHGLKRCSNMFCFLYGDENGNIGSITELDYMLMLGPEHRKTRLSKHGFAWPQVPEAVQPVTDELR
jgi:hypothetical protein